MSRKSPDPQGLNPDVYRAETCDGPFRVHDVIINDVHIYDLRLLKFSDDVQAALKWFKNQFQLNQTSLNGITFNNRPESDRECRQQGGTLKLDHQESKRFPNICP